MDNHKKSPALELVPSLAALVSGEALRPEVLAVAWKANDRGAMRIEDRHKIIVSDGGKSVEWQAPGLRELFRGDRVPPSLEHYPEEYTPYFYFIEQQLLAFSESGHEPTDQQMEETFSNLRRRPDGRSLGALHDFVWQVAALLLGKYVLSGAEFEAIFTRLAHSAQTWSMRPVSRNYLAYLKQQLGEE